DRVAVAEVVGRVLVIDRDRVSSAPVALPESQAADGAWKPRREPQPANPAPHAAEALDQPGPGAGKRGHVEAVAGVVRQVGEIHECGLSQVVISQLEVADL